MSLFSQLGLGPLACASLARLGYETPTPVQAEAIPLVLRGVDLLARAQTGTGKTAAFGLPTIERLMARKDAATGRNPRVLVLVPTRELALQVYQALAGYASGTPLRLAAIFGGVSLQPQTQALRRGLDIIVATPGRLIDHMQQRNVDLSAISVLILDEADRMLDMGFRPALRRIVPSLPKQRQTLLFSATLSDEVIGLSADFTRDPMRVDVSARQVVASTVTHHVHDVAVDRKRDVLSRILTQDHDGQALVFCRTKRGANRVGEDLERRGVSAGVIHGNKSQNARNRALDEFKSGRVRVLVATDIAARGLDIVQLPLVVNYDLPLVAEDYVHRVGRTGRAGHGGRAVSLVSAEEAPLLRQIQKVVAAPLERVATPVVAAGAPEPRLERRVAPVANHGRGGHRAGAPAAHRPAARRHAPPAPGARGPRSAHRRPSGGGRRFAV